MDDLLKLGFIFAPAGYLLLYTGVRLQLFGYVAKILATVGVFASLIGVFCLLYFGCNKLFPQVQSLSSIFQLLSLFLLFGVSGCLLLFFLKYLTGLDQNYHLEIETE